MTGSLWDRYRAWLCDVPDLDFRLDVSRMSLPADYLRTMEGSVHRAFEAMEALEAGAIANPDENRRVGHYWLRAPELAPMHNTYILAQSMDGVVIVDQHAAQEQIFFEQLTTVGSSQPLAFSQQIQLLPNEAELLGAHLEEYRSIGIKIEPFGVNTFRVMALPERVKLDPAELITALVQEHDRYRTLDGDALRDKLAAKTACLSALKAGDVLEHDQQQVLLNELVQIYSPATCPYGRPTFVALRLEELERRLGRR